MFDLMLTIAVVLLPTLFAVVIELVSKKIKERPMWRIGVLGFGMSLSALTGVQIYRATKAAEKDREEAITETSQKVSAAVSQRVTQAVTQQYEGMISDQKQEIQKL